MYPWTSRRHWTRDSCLSWSSAFDFCPNPSFNNSGVVKVDLFLKVTLSPECVWLKCIKSCKTAALMASSARLQSRRPASFSLRADEHRSQIQPLKSSTQPEKCERLVKKKPPKPFKIPEQHSVAFHCSRRRWVSGSRWCVCQNKQNCSYKSRTWLSMGVYLMPWNGDP